MSISVSAAAYARIDAAAKELGISRAELLRLACADILDPAQPDPR